MRTTHHISHGATVEEFLSKVEVDAGEEINIYFLLNIVHFFLTQLNHFFFPYFISYYFFFIFFIFLLFFFSWAEACDNTFEARKAVACRVVAINNDRRE